MIRRLFSFMMTVLVLVAGAALVYFYFTTRGPQCARNWDQVKEGMSQKEVAELLGEPTAKKGPPKFDSNTDDSSFANTLASGLTGAILGGITECWEWEPEAVDFNKLSDSEKLKQMMAGKLGFSQTAFLVYFDAKGNVHSRRAPQIGKYAEKTEKK
jgi:hypothetical protein